MWGKNRTGEKWEKNRYVFFPPYLFFPLMFFPPPFLYKRKLIFALKIK
jgi:hypothetical protein